ncbi:MAG: hypothetical protein FK730_13210 [Asgard group archaeon]|nr:hypothetical protein [Asgard group archaeon]
MFNNYPGYFRKLFQKINSLKSDNMEDLTYILQTSLNDIVDNLQLDLVDYKCAKIRKISINKFDKKFGYDFGIKRSRNISRFASWLFDLSKLEKEALLTFLLGKEALLHFISISDSYPIFSESLINVIVFLWMNEKGLMKSFSNRTVSYINVRKRLLDPQLNNWFIINFILFVVLEIPFKEVIDKYSSIKILAEENSWSDKLLLKSINDWISSLYTIEDFVSPFYFQKRYIEIIKLMLKLGYDNSSTSMLAANMNIHPNSARNYLVDITKRVRIWWLPIWDLEKFHLQSYTFLLNINSINDQTKVLERLKQIPYVKIVYSSKEENESLAIFSDSVCCPSSFEDFLNKQFNSWQQDNLVKDYILQHRNAFISHNTLSSKKIVLNIANYMKLTEKLDEYVFRYKNIHTEKYLPSNQKDKLAIPIDYNLLFFKSVYRFRGVIKSSYVVFLDKFYELCEKNNIKRDDHDSTIDFLNQLEIRSRRRELYDYSLIFSPVHGLENILIIEIPFSSNKELRKLSNLIDKYFIFSFTTQHNLDDRVILMVRGGFTYKHPIFDYLKESLEQNGFALKYYNVKWNYSNPISFHNLFDYENNQWSV